MSDNIIRKYIETYYNALKIISECHDQANPIHLRRIAKDAIDWEGSDDEVDE
jgi:hypothetical protein